MERSLMRASGGGHGRSRITRSLSSGRPTGSGLWPARWQAPAGPGGSIRATCGVGASRVLDEAVVEGIAGAADCTDRVDGTPAVERLAQTSDVDIDRAFVDIHIATPDAIQQLLARENASRILHQEFEQAEFRRPQ